MKNYINRLKNGCHPGVFVFWWIFRLLMVYAFFACFKKDNFDITVPIQLGATLIAMFSWELCMAAPEKSFLRLLPASMQTVSVPMLFIAGFCGKFLDLYYSMPWLDASLQFLFGAVAVFFGYEVAVALVRRDKYGCTKAMHFYVAFGIAFIAINALELWEFTLDQLLGMISGEAGNAQYWSFELAKGTVREQLLVPALDPGRWPIMDIMADIVLSTVSAFIALLIINLYPYRLRGRFKYQLEFGDEDASKKQYEKVNGEKK